MADNAFDDLLDTAEEIESEETYGERLAYIAGDCSLTDGIDDLDDWDRTVVIHRAFADVDAALSAKLLIGIADLENLSVPPWAGSVGAARNALVAHEQAWVDLLEDEMLLASRISNEGTLEDRQVMIQDLADLRELASPSIAATWETAERRFIDSANSDRDEQRVALLFAGTEADCSNYEQALERWGP